MTLGDLITRLEAEPRDKVVRRGFGHAHSYRGNYANLAFEPAASVTVGAMMDAARSALGETFTGYKGGEFKMHEYTDVYLAEYGSCGEEIGPTLLDYMLADVKDAAP